MSGKCDKSLKTAFLKITKFCNISETRPKKSKSLDENVQKCPNWLKVCPTERICRSKSRKKYLHVHY